ncbi:RNA methyltransferase [Algihabitans albus]|uniref:RNA methyltransferase n=1 Tax=Algihabitans albus TaxID=2164067 RepID=UPI000E5CB164|nr:RNA methyltransferase [Algihabitans albus]
MRGYFGFGVEGISKPLNLGTLMRSAHAFGASFFFTLEATFSPRQVRQSDTSDASKHLPLYVWDSLGQMQLPRGCSLVGVELTDQAVELPSFRHPLAAAYVLGPERGSLSPELQARCDLIVKIPTRFCVNVGIAGALVMYDRTISMGRFAPRPVKAGAPTDPLADHVHGGPVIRTPKPA